MFAGVGRQDDIVGPVGAGEEVAEEVLLEEPAQIGYCLISLDDLHAGIALHGRTEPNAGALQAIQARETQHRVRILLALFDMVLDEPVEVFKIIIDRDQDGLRVLHA